MLCLGVDSGTTSFKGLVLDIDSGKVIAQASATHAFIDGLPRGRLQQDPHTWCDAAEQVFQTCLEGMGNIAMNARLWA